MNWLKHIHWHFERFIPSNSYRHPIFHISLYITVPVTINQYWNAIQLHTLFRFTVQWLFLFQDLIQMPHFRMSRPFDFCLLFQTFVFHCFWVLRYGGYIFCTTGTCLMFSSCSHGIIFEKGKYPSDVANQISTQNSVAVVSRVPGVWCSFSSFPQLYSNAQSALGNVNLLLSTVHFLVWTQIITICGTCRSLAVWLGSLEAMVGEK